MKPRTWEDSPNNVNLSSSSPEFSFLLYQKETLDLDFIAPISKGANQRPVAWPHGVPLHLPGPLIPLILAANEPSLLITEEKTVDRGGLQAGRDENLLHCVSALEAERHVYGYREHAHKYRG